MTLASFDLEADTLTWLSIGNVTGLLMRADPSVIPARQHLLLRGGVVGYRLPPLRTFTETLSRGDTLILATDGIRSSFLEDIPMGKPAQQMADHLLLNHSRQTDDALVVVARYHA
jgi:serine phosphatase RsbU (regulator of sigma subunit)